jgi:hypothetical protein
LTKSTAGSASCKNIFIILQKIVDKPQSIAYSTHMGSTIPPRLGIRGRRLKMSTTVTINTHILGGNIADGFLLDKFLPEFMAAAAAAVRAHYPNANINWNHNIQERASGWSRGTQVEVVQDGEFSEDIDVVSLIDYHWEQLCQEDRFYE